MKTLVILYEEPSAEMAVETILQSILPADWDYKPIRFNGKMDMDRNLEKKIKYWSLPDSFFVVLRDKDSEDCVRLKGMLREKCAAKDNVLIRIACHELESWFLGDLLQLKRV